MKWKKKISFLFIFIAVLSMLISLCVSAAPQKRTGTWKRNSIGVRYVNKNGKFARRSWKTIKRKTYYFDKRGYRVNGWLKQKGKIYYFNKKGVMKKGWLKYLGNKYYFSKKTGEMLTGVQKLGRFIYYFEKNGQLNIESGLFSDGKYCYYIDYGGRLHTGWQKINGTKCYFDAWGRLQKNVWISYGGKKYYVNSKGNLETNRWVGKSYVGIDGAVEQSEISSQDTKQGFLKKEILDKMNLENTWKLMVVAHPDDETLWGGGHLAEGKYLVVCLTNGNNATRKAEFEAIVNASGNKGIILSYPDLINGIKSNWGGIKSKIRSDLNLLMSYKKWANVVTHNPDGEYGHIHHKMTSALVTQSYHKYYWEKNLIYFGRYFQKNKIGSYEKDIFKLPLSNYNQKIKLLSLYKSQQHVVKSAIHMVPYEDWIMEQDW